METGATLPAAPGRNTFRVAIVPKDGRETLAEQEFVWPEHTTENSFVFDIGGIVEKSGPGAYQAKIYSGPEPFAWRSFRIIAKR